MGKPCITWIIPVKDINNAKNVGGEAAVVKLRPVPTLSGQDMLITANVTEQDHEKIWRYMKMACGENPVQICFNGP